ALVAFPTRTISSPVANGSSVPAWPTFNPAPMDDRRTCSTTSCEVTPAGLETSRMPSPDPTFCMNLGRRVGGKLRRGAAGDLSRDLPPQKVDELLRRLAGGEAGGLPVAASTLLARDHADVDGTRGSPKTHFVDPRPISSQLLTDERRDHGA